MLFSRISESVFHLKIKKGAKIRNRYNKVYLEVIFYVYLTSRGTRVSNDFIFYLLFYCFNIARDEPLYISITLSDNTFLMSIFNL